MDDLDKNEYLSIKKSSEGFFKNKGSKFFGYAFPFRKDEELKSILLDLKKQHYGARHFCYAYRVDPENILERANDDGEPGHTAGTPILGQIQSNSLVNVLIVVVRFFGGTKLGVSGLINAYKSAARDAIENASIVKIEVQEEVIIEFDYADMNDIMRVVKRMDPRIIKQTMHLRVEMRLSIRKDKIPLLKESLQMVKSVTFIP